MADFARFQLSTGTRNDEEALDTKQYVPPTEARPMGITTNANTGAASLTIKDGVPQVEQHGVQQFNPSMAPDGPGPLASARTLTGIKLTSFDQVTDSTRFTLEGGIEVDAVTAARVGLIQRDGPNIYSEAEAPAEGAAEGAEVDDGIVNHLSSEAVGVLNELDSALGSTDATDGCVVSVLNKLTTAGPEAAAQALTSRTGIEPERALQIVEGMSADARSSAAAHMKKVHGVGEEAFQWAEKTMNAGDRVNLAYRIFMGDARAFKELAQKYIHHMEMSLIRAQK